MSIPSWQVENVPDPNPVYQPDKLFDILAEAVDREATAFPEPARFRAAIYRVLAHADAINVEALAAAMAWQRLERIFACLQHFKRPEVTADVIRIVAGMHHEQGEFMAQIAAKHGMTRQSLYDRVESVSRFLGIEYRRTKPHKTAAPKPYGASGFLKP